MNQPESTPVISVQQAEIDRDRDITVSLLDAALNIVSMPDSDRCKGVDDAMVQQAKTFLSTWFQRKSPSLEMPKL